jgi:hypothetical protein
MSTFKRQQKQVRKKSKIKLREFNQIDSLDKKKPTHLFEQQSIKRKKSQKISKK